MKYLKYSAGLICLLGLFTACKEEFLDRPPQDTVVDANFYRTPEQVLAGTAPLYNIVWFAYNDKASHGLGDARGGVLFSPSYQVDNVRMNTTGVTGENGSSWRSFYNVVGQSNTLISNINKYSGTAVPEAVKQQAIGEARFMRGLAYSYLVQNWGPVPIITNNTTLLQDTSIARNTVESVWEFIIRDMRFATENLPTVATQRGRLNKWAAEGMLAKMYLTRAGISGTRNQSDLDSAAYFAKRVIDNSGASLLPNYEDLFLMKNNNNPESLFALQWSYNGTWGSQNSVQAFLAYSSSITGFADGWGGDIGASKYILDKYEPTDKRRKATFMLPGDHYSYIHQQVNDPANPGKTLVKELDVPLNTVNGQKYNTRAWVKKYVVGRPEDNDGRVLQQRTEINTYMLRLADVYLIYAEAVLGNNASTSDALALQYFNAVRARAGLQPKNPITWDDLYNDRLLEFAMEGQAWYDLVRLHYYNPQKAFSILNSQDRGSYRIVPNSETNATSWTITSDTPAFYPVNEGNFYLPYPATELSRAPNLRKPPVPYDFSKQ
jgi:hypothetical protein